VEPGVVLGAVEAKPFPAAVCDEAGRVVDELRADAVAGVGAGDGETMVAGASAIAVVIPELLSA